MSDFAEFYAKNKDPVLRAVRVTTANADGAEDAAAEAFVRAYARWPSLRDHPSPRAWVIRTALNAHRSWWRRLRREHSRRPWDVDRPAPPEPSPFDEELRSLVAGLPRRQREVIALRLLADLSAADTALLLGIAPSTVDVHLHRALGSLRNHLTPRPDQLDGRLR